MKKFTRKRNNYWTEEKLYKEACKHTNFKSLHASVQRAIKRLKIEENINKIIYEKVNWLDLINYTKENCLERFIESSSLCKFKEYYPEAYEISKKNNWIEYFLESTSVSKIKYPRGYWNYENCKNEALKFDDVKIFKKKSPSCFSAISRKGLYDELCSNMDGYKGAIDMEAFIYVCFLRSEKLSKPFVYVGITQDKKNRFDGHRGHFRYHTSPIFKTMKEFNLNKEDNAQIVWSDPLTVSIARELERKYIDNFRIDNKYTLLNRTAGGERINITRWTPDLILKECKKYNNFNDFYLYSARAYKMGIKLGLNSKIKQYYKSLNVSENQLYLDLGV